MFKWIRENNWLPTVYLASAIFLILGGADLVFFGPVALVPSALYAGSIVVARKLPWMAISLVLVGEASQILLNLTPTVSSLSVAVAILVIATFGSRRVRNLSLALSILSAIVVIGFLSFGPYATFDSLGVSIREDQRLLAVIAAVVLTSGWLTLAWLLGRLAFVRMEHIGSPMDRALTLLSQARLNFELARQNERLEIAKDLSELLVQRVAAVLSLTEGGIYAVKQNPEVSSRVLERSSEAAKLAQVELRRLFDLLHSSTISGGVGARLADLDALVIAYRELGYNAELRTEGDAFELDEGAELCLYKIVFESLENVRKHTKRGTTVTVEFTWVGDGLQLMIKDNGVEYENRTNVGVDELIDGYGIEEDFEALVQQIDGATLSALRDRAVLYEGTVDAVAEPGIGFTVSAIFPNLKTVVAGK